MPPNIHHKAASLSEAHDAATHFKPSDASSSSPLDHDLLAPWATVDPSRMGVDPTPYAVRNLVNGQWVATRQTMDIIHPLDETAPPLFTLPDSSIAEDLPPFVQSLQRVPKSGVHNPLKHPERYLMLGEVSRQAGNLLASDTVAEYFTNLIMTCVPKSHGTYC